MKIGIVGCGGIGMMHAKALHVLSQFTDIQVSAIADGRKECRDKVKALWADAEEFEEGMDLIEKTDAPCIYICLPSYLHTKYATAAMRRGKAVFIEKPVCIRTEDMDELLLAQTETGQKAMVGQVVRWFPEYRTLKEIYDTGRLGRLKSVTMHRICGRPLWSFENWFVDLKKSGSVVMDLHIHDIDFIRSMLGEPEQLTVRGTSFADGMPNQVLSILDYGKTYVAVEGCWDVSTALPFQSGYRACFEKATVEYDGARQTPLIIYGEDGSITQQKPEVEDIPCDAAGINLSDVRPYFEEDRYFMDCLVKNRPIEKADLADGIASARLGCRILKEILEG